MHQAGIATVGDLARADVAHLHAMFGTMGPHLHELALGHDPRPVVGDYERKSYGEENTFEQDLALDSLELARVLVAHSDALGRRLRADRVRARTVTLKLKLARPLGQGRYPIITRSQSLEAPTDDGAEVSRVARALLGRVRERERVRLAGVQVHNLVRDVEVAAAQLALFGAATAHDARRDRLNRALDKVAARFGEEAVTRGLAHAERAAPTRRIK
jgi:DNA polymerase-4